jgi:hypothetical protein
MPYTHVADGRLEHRVSETTTASNATNKELAAPVLELMKLH